MEITMLTAGYLADPQKTTAAQAILIMIQLQFQMVGLGLQQASCTVIGIQLGANNIQKGKEYYKVTLVISIVVLTLLVALFALIKTYMIELFTPYPIVRGYC
jgi:Na+-driven multidrug efflux pump